MLTGKCRPKARARRRCQGPIALTVERHGRPARAEAAERSAQENAALTRRRQILAPSAGRCKWPVARAIGRPRWGSTFRVIRRDPLIARPLRHKLAGIIDRLRFFNETSRTKRPTPLLEGGVGERLCRWGRKPAIRDATASVRSRFRRPLAPTPRAGLRRT